MTAAAVRRAGQGSGSRSRRTAPQEPVRRHDSCAVCGGPVTYYPRRSDDVAPRTCSVDEADRWAHDKVSDWLGRPHRARPSVDGGDGGLEGLRAAGNLSGTRNCLGTNVREGRGVR